MERQLSPSYQYEKNKKKKRIYEKYEEKLKRNIKEYVAEIEYRGIIIFVRC